MKNNKNNKGFTLIELLVVIAIIAILAVVVVLTLNPAELLRQARDSNRISDFATIKSAIALYSEDVSTSTNLYGTSYRLYTADIGATTTIAVYTTATGTAGWGFAGGETIFSITTSTSRAVDGTGWIPVNLTAISSGAPVGSYPVDPTNAGQNAYIYAASSTVWKVATKMESSKYGFNGSGDVVTNDGGNNMSTYEQGSNLTGL
jgi:prepilin-type N-terminal cleavage/methylation domain-containing protein